MVFQGNCARGRTGHMINHLIIQFLLYYLSSGRLRELKTKENFKLLVLNVVVVAFERWSLTRGSKYSDLTGKLLVFWKTARWGEVVATGSSTVLPSLSILSTIIWQIFVSLSERNCVSFQLCRILFSLIQLLLTILSSFNSFYTFTNVFLF